AAARAPQRGAAREGADHRHALTSSPSPGPAAPLARPTKLNARRYQQSNTCTTLRNQLDGQPARTDRPTTNTSSRYAGCGVLRAVADLAITWLDGRNTPPLRCRDNIGA